MSRLGELLGGCWSNPLDRDGWLVLCDWLEDQEDALAPVLRRVLVEGNAFDNVWAPEIMQHFVPGYEVVNDGCIPSFHLGTTTYASDPCGVEVLGVVRPWPAVEEQQILRGAVLAFIRAISGMSPDAPSWSDRLYLEWSHRGLLEIQVHCEILYNAQAAQHPFDKARWEYTGRHCRFLNGVWASAGPLTAWRRRAVLPQATRTLPTLLTICRLAQGERMSEECQFQTGQQVATILRGWGE